MKKILLGILLLVLLLAAFLAGSWYKQRETAELNPINVNSFQVNVNKSSSTFPDSHTVTDTSSLSLGAVRISPEKQQMIGVKVSHVEKKALNHTIRLLGRVAADETRIYFINATVDGWITEAMPNSAGSFVKKDETLARFYSPEFLSAEQALIFALSSKDRVQRTGKETPAQKDQIAQFDINLQQFRDSLKNLGMGDLQIEEMISTRKYTGHVDITSPSDGFILARNVSKGLRFDKGRELYRIADLSRIWILADVYENEAEYFKPGIEAKVTIPHRKKMYRARVSNVLPVFDPTTRTLKIRLETENPDFTLKPDMFVDVELPITLPIAITVPADAILDSGLKKTVFVDQGNGLFEPREVETGWRLGNQIEIVKGLKPGDRIVMSGTFLIDSESRMEMAAAGMYGTLAKDPVCGVDVSINKAEKAGLKSAYRGKTYYFSSDECKKKFDKNPDQFAKE